MSLHMSKWHIVGNLMHWLIYIFVVVVFSGEVGDWKNHFTVAQNELYDQIIEEGLKGSMLKAFDYVL